MGGEIAWSALDIVAEIVGFSDIEILIHGLTVIRDHFRETEEAEAKKGQGHAAL